MADEDAPDDRLLAAARSGNGEALERLLERHQAQVYRFGMKMCRDPEDAKDILQDTLLAMARGVPDFRGASSMSTWLYTIARSFCLKKRRRSKFAPDDEQSLDSDAANEGQRLAAPEASPDEALAGKQVEQALEQAISSLEPMYREVLLLRDVEGLTAPEVAQVLDVSVQAVKSRLHRARLSVRERVAPLLGLNLDLPAAAPGSCPDVLTLFSRYLEDEISAELCADMERLRGVRPVSRHLRLAETHARPLPHVGCFDAGASGGPGLGEVRPTELPRREHLNPLWPSRLQPAMEGPWPSCR